MYNQQCSDLRNLGDLSNLSDLSDLFLSNLRDLSAVLVILWYLQSV